MRYPASEKREIIGLQELLGPSVIKALGNAFTTAKLRNTGLALCLKGADPGYSHLSQFI
jgi:hypothetical protein